MRTEAIRVLLVEDDPDSALLVEEALGEQSQVRFEVSNAHLLETALEQLEESGFDVVLLDLSLPDAFGVETAQRVLARQPSLPIVVLSGIDDEGLAIEIVKQGAQDYLVKGQGDGNLIARSIQYAIERKRVEERLVYMADHDSLTGLPNRRSFQRRLERAIQRTARSGDPLVVLFLDLDRFKPINDTLGHEAGDQALKAVSERLRSCLRNCDTVSRLGGDEFIIILQGMKEIANSSAAARRILNTLNQPIWIAGQEIFLSASIGIADYPAAGADADSLIKNADAAMYQAKQQGGMGFQFYRPEMNSEASHQLALENDLRRALERGEFHLVFQPILDLASRDVVRLEALLRWKHPQRGLVPPDRFIPLLEETRQIIQVGEWVLAEGCAHCKSWHQAGFEGLQVAVNCSALQFQEGGLVAAAEKALNGSGLAPHCLTIELTERLLAEQTDSILKQLSRLREKGVRFAIDDFGTGYSSLSYLKHFPLDSLKIDRSFVSGIPASRQDIAIAKTVLALARNLGLQPVAEGVETEEQMLFLSEQGCRLMQGYLFSPPLTADRLSDFLKRPRTIRACERAPKPSRNYAKPSLVSSSLSQ